MNPPRPALSSEFLILPDGTLLAHNLTPQLAEALQGLSPLDPRLQSSSSPLTPNAVPADPSSVSAAASPTSNVSAW